jgi:hypothetical protein
MTGKRGRPKASPQFNENEPSHIHRVGLFLSLGGCYSWPWFRTTWTAPPWNPKEAEGYGVVPYLVNGGECEMQQGFSVWENFSVEQVGKMPRLSFWSFGRVIQPSQCACDPPVFSDSKSFYRTTDRS